MSDFDLFTEDLISYEKVCQVSRRYRCSFLSNRQYSGGVVKRPPPLSVGSIYYSYSNSKFYSKQEIESIYNVKMTFLCYTSLIRSLPSIVKTTNYKLKRYHPILPYKVGLIHGKTKLSRVAYREFQTALIPKYSQTQAKLEQKWIRDIGCFHLGSMSDVCSVTKNTYIQTFHFRIINRIIATKRYYSYKSKFIDLILVLVQKQQKSKNIYRCKSFRLQAFAIDKRL